MNATSTVARPKLVRAFARMESRWKRHRGYRQFTTKAEARVALNELAELVATVGLYLPIEKCRWLDPVMDALEQVAGPWSQT